MTRFSAREGDENEAEAPLFHWRRGRMSGVPILHCILENNVSLLINAVECAQEEAPVTYPHQHLPK